MLGLADRGNENKANARCESFLCVSAGNRVAATVLPGCSSCNRVMPKRNLLYKKEPRDNLGGPPSVTSKAHILQPPKLDNNVFIISNFWA